MVWCVSCVKTAHGFSCWAEEDGNQNSRRYSLTGHTCWQIAGRNSFNVWAEWWCENGRDNKGKREIKEEWLLYRDMSADVCLIICVCVSKPPKERRRERPSCVSSHFDIHNWSEQTRLDMCWLKSAQPHIMHMSWNSWEKPNISLTASARTYMLVFNLHPRLFPLTRFI